MKLMDLLKLMNKNDFVYLGVEVCGMQFETKHSVDFFIDNADILNDKEILGTYLEDGNFHIRLEKQNFHRPGPGIGREKGKNRV